MTIGIPVYRDEDHVVQALASAFAQTHASIEFLIVDDAGGDGSMERVRRFAAEHPRGQDLRIISFPENRGVSAARNRIIEEAQGQYLYFMDADDTMEPGTISLLMAQARSHDAEVVFGSYRKTEVSGAVTFFRYEETLLMGRHRLADHAYRRLGGIQASACNILIDVALLRRHRHRFIATDYWEDMVFVLDLVPLVERAVLLPQVTYHYRCREQSLSHYQHRGSIEKREVLRNAATLDYLKQGCERLRGKPYYGQRCLVVMAAEYYLVCHILRRRKDIRPAVTAREMRRMMRHPAPLGRIRTFRKKRWAHLGFWLVGRLPASLCVGVVNILRKIKA